MNKYLIPLAIFGCLVVFLGIGLTLNPREIPSPYIDKPAPEFELPELSLSSDPVSLNGLKDEPWIFNVFASWCVACQHEHPLLMELSKRKLIKMVGLNYKDKRQDAQNWLARHGDPYDAIAFDALGDVGIDYGVYGVPETFVIDGKGHIRMKHIGPLTPEVLKLELLPLIDKIKRDSP